MKSFKTLLLCASTLGLLAACSSGHSPKTQHISGNSVDAALQRVAAKTSQRDSLPFLETVYRRNSSDPMAALSYAQALRLSADPDRAVMIMAPFALDEHSPAAVKTEYAAIQLALGNYESALGFAEQASAQSEDNYEALHYLAIAKDALGQHAEAESSFRAALKAWKGDPVPVLNNLALNLATQKRGDEAMRMISQAAALAPERQDIQRNRIIISQLSS